MPGPRTRPSPPFLPPPFPYPPAPSAYHTASVNTCGVGESRALWSYVTVGGKQRVCGWHSYPYSLLRACVVNLKRLLQLASVAPVGGSAWKGMVGRRVEEGDSLWRAR